MDATLLGKQIPDAVLPYPDGAWNRFKYVFWKVVYPVHNRIRNMLLALHILHHEGRQNYSFGFLAPGKDADMLVKYLETQGFGNHFIAWEDDGQVASLRKLDGFAWQYHIRIFKDDEVRGHYEYTPESHPFMHYRDEGVQERREEFMKILGDWVAPTRTLGKSQS